MNQQNSAIPLVMGILAGLFMLYWGGHTLVAQAHAVNTYEPTEATVVSSSVSVSRSSQGTMYSADVTYTYTVDGKTYRSSDVRPGPGGWRKGEQWARRVVRNHPEGKQVTAYYDPNDPSESYLVEDRSLFWPGVVAVAGAGLSVALSWHLLKN